METTCGQTTWNSAPITIQCQSGGGRATWTLASGDLPRLEDCRARLVWRHAGETQWRDDLIELPAFSGDHFAATLQAGALSLDLTVCQTANGGWEFGGRLSNAGQREIELARFHFLDGALKTDLLLAMQFRHCGQPYCCHLGQQAPPIRPPRASPGLWGEPPVCDTWLPDVIYDEPDWVCAVDGGAFVRQYSEPGWILGATGPGIAAGEIGIRSAGADVGHFFAGQLLDNILLGPGETRELERMLVVTGDWQDGMREWAAVCARELGASPRKGRPLAGFCSWVRNFGDITTADIDRAIEEFARLPVPPGGRMIQIDDGFQMAPGDWRPNPRFPADWWRQLPERISASGSIPTLWLAPLSVLETNPMVKEHPEWFQRLPDGRFPLPMMNWGWCDNPSWRFGAPGGHLAYNLEIDHPEARSFVRRLLEEQVEAGWRAFKLDFCYMGCNARAAYDRRKTTFETLRGMYRLFREAVGPDVLLNACGGAPSRFPLGYADSARLSSDMVGGLGNDPHLAAAVLDAGAGHQRRLVGGRPRRLLRAAGEPYRHRLVFRRRAAIQIGGGAVAVVDGRRPHGRHVVHLGSALGMVGGGTAEGVGVLGDGFANSSQESAAGVRPPDRSAGRMQGGTAFRWPGADLLRAVQLER